MKKKILLMLTLLAGVMTANAADEVVVNDVTIPKGGEATVAIELNNPDNAFRAFQIDFELPAGITFADPAYAAGPRIVEAGLGANLSTPRFTYLLTGTDDPFMGSKGTLFYIYLKADADLAEGTVLNAKLTNGIFTGSGGYEMTGIEVPFTITVAPAGVILDEDNGSTPKKTASGPVTVIRTMKANEWSTICLPFDMDYDQLKEAFGDGVKMASFSGYTYDSAESQITLEFDEEDLAKDGLIANYPYMIKASKDVTSFSLTTAVESKVDEAEESVKVGKKYQKFNGVQSAGVVPENSLFMSDNKLYYSTGKTIIKGFRCYFTFTDILPDESRIILNFDEATGIDSVTRDALKDGKVYDLNGRQVKTAKKGVFIVNGKKVVVK